VTGKGVVEEMVPVDAAALERQAAIEAERIERVGDTFHALHPKLRRETIVPVREAEHYLITVDDVVFKVVWLSPEKLAVGRVDPKDHDVLLEPAQPVRLPRAPEPPPAPSLVALAVAYEERCNQALDQYRNHVANWEQAIGPLTSAEGFRARWRDLYPGTIPSVARDKRLANLDGLHEGAQAIITVAGYARTVPAQGTDARRLVIEASTAIETALASVRRPVVKSTRLAGEPDMAMQSSEERRLLKLQGEVVDKLLAGVADLASKVAGLQAVTPIFLSAALHVLREGYCEAVVIIQQATAEKYLRPLRAWGPEREASALVAALAQEIGQAITAPEIQWSPDLLEAPKLG
jgi:hypothetical protein